MENHCSSMEKVVQALWKGQRAVFGLPINPNLVPGRVLCKRSDGYYDVGTVHSLSKPGSDKDWLEEALRRRRGNKSLPPLSQPPYVVSDDDGAFAKALVGPVYAAAWFKEFESVEVHVPEFQIREFDNKERDELMEHFDPDLRSGPLQTGSELELFIVQKVLLVSQIKITASYGSDTAGLEFKSSAVLFQNVKIEASFQTTSSNIIGEFTLSATEKNRKLPVAFSGFSRRYDKFGVVAKETCCQADGEVGESSGASQSDSDSEEDDPGSDPDVGPLLEFNVDSLFAEAKYNLELFDLVEEDEQEGDDDDDDDGGDGDGDDDDDDDEVVDQNAAGMEDID